MLRKFYAILIAAIMLLSTFGAEVTFADSNTINTQVDGFTASGITKNNMSAAAINIGGDNAYIAYFSFDLSEAEERNISYASLNLTTLSKPSTAITMYVRAIKENANLITNDLVSDDTTAPLFDESARTDNIISEVYFASAPAKKTQINLDITDYVRTLEGDVLTLCVTQVGAMGKYGWQFYSAENAVDADYVPTLSLGGGDEYDIKYDLNLLEIENYVDDTKNITANFTLPVFLDRADGYSDSTVSWASDNDAVLSVDNSTGEAVITPLSENTKVKLTATLSKGAYSLEKEFTLTITGAAPDTSKKTVFSDIDGFASSSVDKVNMAGGAINVGGDNEYIGFYKFDISSLRDTTFSYASFNFTTLNMPSVPITMYVHQITENVNLITQTLNGINEANAPLLDEAQREDNVIAHTYYASAPAKLSVVSVDITDLVRTSTDGIIALAMTVDGAQGRYGWQLYSAENTVSEDYVPTLTLGSGDEYDVKYDQSRFEIASYIPDINSITENFTLPITLSEADGFFGSAVSYMSDDPSIIKINSDTGAAEVTAPFEDTLLALTAIISKGDYKLYKSFFVTVKGDGSGGGDEEEKVIDTNFYAEFQDEFSTYLRKGDDGNVAYYDVTTMYVDGRESSARLGFIRFKYGSGDGESLEGLLNSTNQITLRLKFKKLSWEGGVSLYGVNDEVMKNSCDKTQMCYNKAVELGIFNALGTISVPHIATLDTSKSAAGEFMYFDVTDYVKKQTRKTLGSGSEASFAFVVKGYNHQCESDILSIGKSSSANTDTLNIPLLTAQSGHAGYLEKHSLALDIDKKYQVSEDFSLPTLLGDRLPYDYQTKVDWKSSNESIIALESAPDGTMAAKVTCPPSSAADNASVTLTATMTNGEETTTKEFVIDVCAKGMFNSTRTNYVRNAKGDSAFLNSVLYTYVKDGDKYVSFVTFDTSDKVFGYADKIFFRVKPYYMTGAFTVTMTPITADNLPECTPDMTWNEASGAIGEKNDYAVSFVQPPDDFSWIEFDVTNYVKTTPKAVFRFEIDAASSSTFMLFGNDDKNKPQLRVFNYETVSDAEKSVQRAYTNLAAKMLLQKDALMHISDSFALPQKLDYGVTAAWEVLDASGTPSIYLNSSGNVLKRPENSDVTVRLRATITRDDYTEQPLVYETEAVVAHEMSGDEALDYCNEKMAFECPVICDSGLLPRTYYGVTAQWSVDDDSVTIEDSSYSALRGGFDRSVTFTAVLSHSASARKITKKFTVTILRSGDENILKNIRSLEEARASNDDDSATYAVSDTFTYEFPMERSVGDIMLIPFADNTKLSSIEAKAQDGEWVKLFSAAMLQSGENTFTAQTAAKAKYIRVTLEGEMAALREIYAYEYTEGGNNSEARAIVESKGFTGAAKIPQSAVKSDFTLLKTVYGAAVTYTSSNENVISITEKSDGFYCSVTQATKAQSVSIRATVTAPNGKSASKSFVVSVKGKTTIEGGGGGSGGSGGGKGTTITPIINVAPPVKEAFSDLSDAAWAKQYITYLAAKKLINGRENGTFEPNAPITRAEFVKIFVGAANIALEGECSFSDVDKGAWYYPYIAAAFKAGLVGGVTKDTFCPNAYITRQDVAVIVSRYLGGASAEVTTHFSDEEKIAPYALESVLHLQSLGILGGDENGNVNPTANTTRAQSAKIICELFGKDR